MLISTAFFCSCESEKTDLIIFHAGSLSKPLLDLEKAFEEKYPHINLVREADGSRVCARKISDLKRDCDLMLSADYKVVENILMPEYADWILNFAINEIVIAYTEKSKYRNELTSNNWFKILEYDDVSFGRTEPNADPCGYRAILSMKLQQRLNNDLNVERLIEKSRNYVRPTENEISTLLRLNEIDFAFLYKSVAIQYGFEYLELSDSVNLSNKNLSKFYSNVKVELSGKNPDETIFQYGVPIIYGLTIPKNSKNPELAKLFIEFLISESAKDIFSNNHQNIIEPYFAKSSKNPPTELISK
jgi:molybdate/tungstate transport system substrate-binding protein